MAFREGTTNANNISAQFVQHESDAAKYHLVISRVSGEATSLALGQYHASRATLSSASGFLLFPWVLGGGHLLWETP